MTTEQDAVITVVKKWCTIENTIKRLSKELKELRQEKKELSENLVEVMKKNENKLSKTKR